MRVLHQRKRKRRINQDVWGLLAAEPEKAGDGPDAVGEYLAALSLAASNSTANAPGLIKCLNTSVLNPTLAEGLAQHA